MSEIPEDVMKTARMVCSDVAFGGGVTIQHDAISPTDEGVFIIACALMTERERLWRELGDIVMVECARAQMTHSASTSLRNAIVARASANAQP